MKTTWNPLFSQWTTHAVFSHFNLSEDLEHQDALSWFNAHPVLLSESLEAQLEFLRKRLRGLYQSWNETELLARFIGPLLNLVDFWGPNYNFFLERKLAVRFGSRKLSGSVDGLVARGVDVPLQPFFFLHVYKKIKDNEGDPKGQLLIAMIAAQHLNANSGPLYGCYVIGPYWRFVYLDGTTFAESQGYDATDAGELQIIWNILHETKRRIEARVALLESMP